MRVVFSHLGKNGGEEMKKVKIVLIGVGSIFFGQSVLADLMASRELKELDLTISLVDIDKAALDRMYRFAGLLKKYHDVKAKIEATTNLENALPEANYVIVSVEKRRKRLWDQDFYIPFAFGFRQGRAETGGPGAAFHALRSLHLVIPICRAMEKLCPDALLINYTNPENRVALGVIKLTRIRCVGLCDGYTDTLREVARILGKSEKDIDINIGGINHFHWVLQMHSRPDEKNLYPQFNQRMVQSDWGLHPLVQRMYEIFGLFPFPAFTHLAEFVSFAYEICGPDYLNRWNNVIGPSSKKEESVIPVKYDKYITDKYILGEQLQRVVKNKEPLTKELAYPTEVELGVPIICDIEFNRNRKELSVNVLNEKLAISNLPEDAVVEISARVDAQGIHPIKVGPLPEAIAAMCRIQISIQKLIIEAYQERSKKLLLQALLIDPMIDSIDRTEKMMEELLKIEINFLPAFR